ncbi:LURP-one-related family protein [Hydrogenoanaerobacterium sp.]|uniref:LURP-one-related/scramblase family protein n=1 Tax=Hydrogenoanaerobacterium sp. TaxID=2953763 RepID=UPI00289D656D|nr:LURP-one-related family protein [Hydrogenoanaerobacterium sp.]
MNLYIRQKVFSFADRYSICNYDGEPIFQVEGEVFSWGAKIRLYTLQGEELFYIKQKLMVFLPEYEIYAGDTLCARVKKEFSFFRPQLTVESTYGNFVLDGSFWAMDFNILCNGEIVGEVHKEWLTWGDTYCLSIPNHVNAAFFSSLVIAIDNCLHNGQNK